MKPCYWLASYPKSGNTWFRLLIANLATDHPVDINDPRFKAGIASDRPPFDHDCWVESEMLHEDEIETLRPAWHRYRASRADELLVDPPGIPFHLLKTHDAYTVTRAGEPVLGGAAATAGVLLLVRDPRGVAPSFAQHLGVTIDQAIQHLGDPRHVLSETVHDYQPQFRQRLNGWSGFNRSWLDQRDLPLHLLSYEALHADPFAVLSAALAFLGWPVAAEAIERAIAVSSFAELARQERERGFVEAPRPDRRFFRRGRAEGWRDELSAVQARRIERDHAAMMAELGYFPGN
jgi:hypothetical protein